MRVQSIATYNWANLPNSTHFFGIMSLISGESGGGKTTIADAVQAVMSGGSPNIAQFNPGQDEANARSRKKQARTLESYILGCDEHRYSRPNGATCILILTIVPDENEMTSPFTAILAAEARLEKVGDVRIAKRHGDKRYWLIEGQVDPSLLRDPNTPNALIPINSIKNTLMQEYGREAVQEPKNNRDYLLRLYRRFRNNEALSAIAAENAAKQFCRFMAYKPTDSVDTFVREHVLEAEDMKSVLTEVRALLLEIRRLEDETFLLDEGIGWLKAIKNACINLVHRGREVYLVANESVFRDLTLAEQRKQQVILALDNLTQQQNELESKIQRKKLKINNLRNEKQELLLKLESIPEYATIQQLEFEAKHYESQMIKAGLQINDNWLAHRNSFKRLMIDDIPPTPPINDPDLISLIEAWPAWVNQLNQWQNLHKGIQLPQQSWLTVAEAQRNTLIDKASKIDAVISQWHSKLDHDHHLVKQAIRLGDRQLSESIERVQLLQREIIALENGNKVQYPQQVNTALDLLKKHIPDADPRVLCDLMEITQHEWSLAIESLLSSNRFVLVVHPKFEIQARVLIRDKGLRNVRVAQTHLALRDQKKRPILDDSICKLVEFNNKYAEAYFHACFGNVRQILDDEILRSTHHGLMENGCYTNNYTYNQANLKESDLVCGRQAREKALNAKRKQLPYFEAMSRQWQNFLNQIEPLQELNIVTSISSLAEPLLEIDINIRDLISLNSRIKKLKASLTLQKLHEDHDKCQKAIKQHEKDKAILERELGGKEQETLIWSDRQKFCQKKLTEAQNQQRWVTNLIAQTTALWTDFDWIQHHENVRANWEKLIHDQQLSSPDDWFSDEVAEWIRDRRVTQEIDLVSSLQQNIKTIKAEGYRFNNAQVRNAQVDFIDTYSIGESLMNHMQEEGVRRLTGLLRSGIIQPLLNDLVLYSLTLSQACDGFLNRFLNDFLMSCDTQLHELRRNFDSVFMENLCHKLFNSISEGQGRLSEMNDKLKKHTFGEEHYQFSWKYNTEFDDFRVFLGAVVKRQTEDGSDLENSNLSQEHQDLLKKLKQDLIEKDEFTALNQLARLSDYRNYRHYDLEKILPNHEGLDVNISLSQYATGSGGQLETPSYVIRAAALSSAFQFDEAGTHCRFVIIDESFGKMDEARSKEVLNYLSGTLGLQVIYVMPTKSAGAFILTATRHTLVVKSATSPPRGELTTRVDVIEKELNNPMVEKLYRAAQQGISNRFMPNFLDALDTQYSQPKDKPENGVPTDDR
ncbi:hypothetical protein L4D21_10150 [Photobacterium profundum]|uniref:SbcC/MukB-like Walker B domain-containing protein n=1 Tax=Photobacterium profundum TaxID=74109 RepID=UPI003D11471A